MQPPSQIHQRLNNRRFTVANNAQGLSGSGTVFHTLSKVMPSLALTRAGGFAWARKWDE